MTAHPSPSLTLGPPAVTMISVPGTVLVLTAQAHTASWAENLQVLPLSPVGLPVTDPQSHLEIETDFWEGPQSRKAILAKGYKAVTWHGTKGYRHG